MRKISFQNNEYYHIFNRGVDKRDIFLDESDYERFLRSMIEFNMNKVDGGLYRKFLREREEERGSEKGSASNLEAEPFSDHAFNPLVDLIFYCLNPNHYHFIIKQLIDNGIVKFMQRLGTSYTMYFNNKNKRNGVLFQGKFKAVKLDTFEHLLWISVYVNANAQIHGIVDDAANYAMCSYPEYIGKVKNSLCNKDVFSEIGDYQNMARDAIQFMRSKKMLKYMID